jgi:hypothetical protein
MALSLRGVIHGDFICGGCFAWVALRFQQIRRDSGRSMRELVIVAA